MAGSNLLDTKTFTLNNNKHAGQKAFSEKKLIYESSKYAMTKRIESTEWTIKMIKHRQQNLAKTAAGIWKK